MASASCGVLMRANFHPLLQSKDGLSSPSLLASTNIPFIHTNKPVKFNGVVAAHKENNATEESDNVLDKTRENGKQKSALNFTGEKPSTPILDTINYPIHIKKLSIEELGRLADELREEIVYTVSKTGGHLSASLGVAELTVALHYVFNTPEDKIIWDVGHQTYSHKILTGRRSRMHTIRQTCGLAGFTKRDESVHDAFGAGHSSTSISAGLGMVLEEIY
ncbi:hypothetical protein ACH5RR_006392 [Cinchona calisaya]|uniref:1-deoxy-D-xylulose-5-phosphate synthase n=1 Tax=Cinchona calisaya TaxID=153742 RepID=A0ABD3ANX5_9GENT